MRTRLLSLVGIVALAIAPASTAEARNCLYYPEDQLIRIAGDDRIETAIEISKYRNPDGEDRVIALANGWSISDSLTAGAASARNGLSLLLLPPISQQGSVDVRVLNEIRRATENHEIHRSPYGPGVVLFGGTGVISQAVEDQIKAEGYAVHRIAGDDRFQTAIAATSAVHAMHSEHSVILADGSAAGGYADAYTAGAVASSTDRVSNIQLGSSPFLLTDGPRLPDSVRYTLELLKARSPLLRIITIGDAASDAVPDAHFQIRGGTPASRAVRVAEIIAPGWRRGTMGFSAAGPDALAAPTSIIGGGGLLPVVGTGPLDPALAEFVGREAPAYVCLIIIYGGVNSVSEATEAQIRELANL